MNMFKSFDDARRAARRAAIVAFVMSGLTALLGFGLLAGSQDQEAARPLGLAALWLLVAYKIRKRSRFWALVNLVLWAFVYYTMKQTGQLKALASPPSDKIAIAIWLMILPAALGLWSAIRGLNASLEYPGSAFPDVDERRMEEPPRQPSKMDLWGEKYGWRWILGPFFGVGGAWFAWNAWTTDRAPWNILCVILGGLLMMIAIPMTASANYEAWMDKYGMWLFSPFFIALSVWFGWYISSFSDSWTAFLGPWSLVLKPWIQIVGILAAALSVLILIVAIVGQALERGEKKTPQALGNTSNPSPSSKTTEPCDYIYGQWRCILVHGHLGKHRMYQAATGSEVTSTEAATLHGRASTDQGLKS